MIARLSSRCLVAGALAGTLVGSAAAQVVEAAERGSDQQFLRVNDQEGESLQLQVATRTYLPRDGAGPRICLVSVAHVADGSLYASLQKVMDEYDVVLYESVKPEGAARPGGDNNIVRVETTRASLRYLASMAELHRDREGRYPGDLEELSGFVGTIDPRFGEWLEEASVDAWETGVVYRLDAGSYEVLSLGADGSPGGTGFNADITLDDEAPVAAPALSSEDGLQAQLADALGLAFQLTSIDYSQSNWRCSDMTVDAVERGLRDQGLKGVELTDTLMGSGLSAKIAKILLQLLKIADALSDGAITDTMKVVMIEMLGNEELVKQALDQQFGRGFAEVIVNQRNQVVIDDLQDLIRNEPDVDSVAIFYGAAHMPDMAERLDQQLGYDYDGVEWFPGISVDLANSTIRESDLRTIRRMIRMSSGFGR